jgi:hypothetical protein
MSTTTNYDMSTLSSIYIPRVYANLSTEFVAETFECLNLGVVDRVEAAPRPGDKTTYMAFVYFASWNTENKAAVHLAERINTPGGPQARIVYDDPWYWILLPNKSEKTSAKKTDEEKFLEEFNRSNSGICAQEWELRQKREKDEENELMEELEGMIDELEFEEALDKQELETEEKMDILFDMIEDLQVRLKVSEKNNERLEKELYNTRTILLTGSLEESETPMSASIFDCPPPPPKLTRQIAAGYSIDDMPRSPPKLVRQNACIARYADDYEFDHDLESGMMTPPPPPPTGPLVRQRQVSAGTDFIPPNPEEFAAKMTAEIAAFQKMKQDWETETGKNWMSRSKEDNSIYAIRVDGMGLVYPNKGNDDDDKKFWCDP